MRGDLDQMEAGNENGRVAKRPFRAFATYATAPDGMLVQKVESFLETLDRNKLVREDMRTKIMLCVDGSDFRLPKVASGDEEPIKQLVAEYLSKSDFLIAFVGPDSRTHPWIRWEIQWWLEHREVETLLVALTGGDDPEADPASLFPPEIVSAGAHRRIWFDLRGFHRRARRSARSLRSFDRELVRLAAYLVHPELSANEFIAHYDQEAFFAHRRAQWWRAGYYTLLGLAIIASGLLLVRAAEYYSEWNAAQLARISAVGDKADVTRVAYAAGAFKLAPSPAHYEILADALQGWLPHVARLEQTTKRPIGTVAYLPQKKIVVTGGFEGVLNFHDVRTTKLLHTSKAEPRINSIVVDPSETMLLAGTGHGLFLFDIAQLPSGEATLVARAFSDEAFFAATTNSNGDFIAGSMAGRVVTMPTRPDEQHLWQPLHNMTLHDNAGASLGISGLGLGNHGKVLIVAALDGNIRGYSADALERQIWSHKHVASIRGLATSAQDASAFIDRGGDIFLIDSATGGIQRQAPRPVQATQLAKTVAGTNFVLDRQQREARTAVSFSIDGTTIAVGSFDGTVELLDAETLNLVGRVKQTDFARQAIFTPDDQLIVSSDDGAVDLYRVDGNLDRVRLSGIKTFDVSPNKGWIAAVDLENRLWTVTADGGKIIPASPPSESPPRAAIKDILVDGSGRNVVAALQASVFLRNWTMKLGVNSIQAEEQKPLEHSNEEAAVHVAHSIARQQGGSIVVSTTTYGANAIYRWDTENNRSKVIDTRKSAIAALDVGRNLIAVGDFGGRVVLYAIGSGSKVDEFPIQAPIETVALDPEESVLFVSSADGEITVCQIAAPSSSSWLTPFRLTFNLTGSAPFQPVATENGVIRCKHRAGEQRVLRAVFSAQQRLIGATKMGMFIARPETGWTFEPLSNDGEAQSLAADDQSGNIAAAIGGVLKVWDAGTRELHASIRVPNPIQRIRFIPGKDHFVATLDGTTLRVWDWSRQALVAEACARWSPYHRIVAAPALISMPDRAVICARPTSGSMKPN